MIDGPTGASGIFSTIWPMPLEPLLIFQLALLGIATGFLAGLLGIGGGMIMVPFISAILGARGVAPGLAVKMAIATSMATIIFTSISSVRAHHKRGAVRWDIVKSLAPGIVLGAMAASLGIFSLLKGSVLALVFAAFVGFSATQMFLDKKPKPTRQIPGPAGLLGAGGFIGLLSGLVGAGGGFVSIPFMTWCNVAIHNAVATSAALGFPIAVANVAGYIVAGQHIDGLPPYSFGYLWLPALIIIASCSVLMAPLGARAAHALPVKKLKRALATILYMLAAYMLYKGLSAL
ncbi:putative membrane protein YfcA [Ottowia thiooxydans]|uniref:Probable membrane transporter protein n=2 Tax=Ottowia thiooxydans TaxID=219182 RepID=A0ABV2Q6U0_9BURK